MRLVAAVEIDRERDRHWLRINKSEADNRALVYDRGPETTHEWEVSVKGTSARFRIWWKSDRSTPYLQAMGDSGWSFEEAYHEIQRLSGFPLTNENGTPDRVVFTVQRDSDIYVLDLEHA